MTHPVRGFINGIAAVVALTGAILITVLARGGFGVRLALLVFGLSLVALFTVSALYHSVPWRARAKLLMRRIDHTMIHVLIAGSFTPVALIVLDGWLRWATLAAQWGVVAAGVIQKFGFKRINGTLSVVLQTTQGWLALLILYPMAVRLPWTAVGLYILGGVLYTVGMVLLVTNRPRLWPRIFSYHEVFHILVVAAASLHFTAAARYLTAFAV
jgi:hemolysin III